jgi:uncharacterized cupin superfamily protein
VDVAALDLEDWPLEADQIDSGTPVVSGRVFDTSADGRVERGYLGRSQRRQPSVWTVHETLRKIYQTTS